VFVLITRKDLPVNNLQEFGAYAKANQAKMQYGSAGAGSATHLGCVLLNYLIGVDITHVPYRGTGPAMQDLQGGRIDYLCEIISTAKPQIDAIRRSLCSPRCSQAASISTDAYLVPAAPPLRPDIISEWV
jgi:tripartite-type tricarboxylate transporter receptor subunit TctC